MWSRISLNPWFKPALLLAACVVCFGLGVRWQRGADAMEQMQTVARTAKARDEEAKRTAKTAAALESKLADLESLNHELTGKIAHETEKPDYRCVLPPRGMQLRSAAIADPPAR